MDAFLSHSSRDAAVADSMVKRLGTAGLKVWLDRSNLNAGRLLRKELQTAIGGARVLLLLWSKPASASRWVAAEILTAIHLGRFIISCVRDTTALPYFLQSSLYLTVQQRKRAWLDQLARAIREAPDALELPGRLAAASPEVQRLVRELDAGQREVWDRLGRGDLAGARKQQAKLDPKQRAAQKRYRFEIAIQNLGGYHLKNAYMVKHWAAIQGGQPPANDPLLRRAERQFYVTLFVDPFDMSALNGLGNILFFERELDAAELFIRKAIAIAERAGGDYAEARHDLDLVLRAKPGHATISTD